MSRIISKSTTDHYQDWDEYVCKKQASIYHDPRWSQLIKKSFGHESHCLMAVEKVFDFGRSSKDAGTLKFKKQWGGYEKQLYWYYDLPIGEPLPGLNPQSKKFGAAISVWKKLPVKVSNLVGPQIVKNLP